jgi:hypothetical protein
MYGRRFAAPLQQKPQVFIGELIDVFPFIGV